MKISQSNFSDSISIYKQCQYLTDILIANNVKYAVLSPGSRNAPLIINFAREPRIKSWIIVDERSAAFAAIGIAQYTDSPVALICTSGSAVLNYAPAISEAYYRNIPIIVISADRPEEWIDQNDSQTIRQHGILSNIVKQSYSLPTRCDDATSSWYADRLINDAIISATSSPKGPVHINMPFRDSLCVTTTKKNINTRIIEHPDIKRNLDENFMRSLADEIATAEKVMIVAGFGPQSTKLNTALSNLASHKNIVVLTETISNLHDKQFINTVDRILSCMHREDAQEYVPQLLITFGGSFVSKVLKKFLRKYPSMQEWRIGIEYNTIDTLQHLTRRIDIEPAQFFSSLDLSMGRNCDTTFSYSEKWHDLATQAISWHNKFTDSIPWCDLKAFSIFMPMIPDKYILHLSNGTSIRYAQLFGTRHGMKCFGNRGVSGIDGSTSTALGTSLVATDFTSLLVTGDMSFSYDINGLTSQYNSNRFKIIVMNNQGGNIFRFINGPSDLPELEKYFEVQRAIPVKDYAKAFGFDYFEADDETSLKSVLPCFFASKTQSILAICTPPDTNAKVLRSYFRMQ